MNRMIVGAGVVIIVYGVIESRLNNTPMTPVFIGGYVFLIVLALLDLFGPPLSNFANAMALIAVVYILVASHTATQVWDVILNAVHGRENRDTSTKPHKSNRDNRHNNGDNHTRILSFYSLKKGRKQLWQEV